MSDETPRPQGWRVLGLIPVVDTQVEGAQATIAAALAAHPTSGHSLEIAFVGLEAPAQLINAARDAGADTIWQFTHEAFDHQSRDAAHLLALSEQVLRHLHTSPGSRVLVLLPASLHAEDIAARLAVRMDGAALGRCLSIRLAESGVEAIRPAYGGRANLRLSSSRAPCFALTHPSAARSPAVPAGRTGEGRLEHRLLTGPLPASPPVLLSDLPEQKRPLEGAGTVVSGGRGMRGEAGFALLQQLADRLDAAVGASLPAVDAGWVPVARQVGYSGKYVTPGRYLAVAISGTPQHLAGIGPDTEIIAINQDPDADIFRVATVGVVADWEALLPPLIDALASNPSEEP